MVALPLRFSGGASTGATSPGIPAGMPALASCSLRLIPYSGCCCLFFFADGGLLLFLPPQGGVRGLVGVEGLAIVGVEGLEGEEDSAVAFLGGEGSSGATFLDAGGSGVAFLCAGGSGAFLGAGGSGAAGGAGGGAGGAVIMSAARKAATAGGGNGGGGGEGACPGMAEGGKGASGGCGDVASDDLWLPIGNPPGNPPPGRLTTDGLVVRPVPPLPYRTLCRPLSTEAPTASAGGTSGLMQAVTAMSESRSTGTVVRSGDPSPKAP